MNKIHLRNILLFAILILLIYSAYAADLPKWFPFDTKNALSEWQEKIFRGKVLYTVQMDKKKEGFLAASSAQACSGLIYKMKFDVYESPMISWDWMVSKFPEKKPAAGAPNDGWIERDDYAARVYVIFSNWNFMNIKTLEYVWDQDLPAGKVMTSPYFENIKIIVTESGNKNRNAWVVEERNIFEDYKTAFGKNPPRFVGAIALMTDSDNTVSTAEAAYQNLKVGYAK